MRFTYRLILVALTIMSTVVKGQDIPGWVDNTIREQQYPALDYFIGFSSGSFKKNDDALKVLKGIESQARKELSDNIYLSINRIAKYAYLDTVQIDNYSKSLLTKEVLEAQGMKTESYIDSKTLVAYAFSYLNKRGVKTYYFKELSNRMTAVRDRLEATDEILDKGESYKTFMDIIDELDEINTVRQLLFQLGITNQTALLTSEWETYKAFANDNAEKLRNTKDISLNEAAFFLAEKIINELQEDITFWVQPVTYKNTGIASEFSLKLNQLLTYELVNKEMDVLPGKDQSPFVLSGTYWPRVDKIQVSITISERFEGEIMRVLASGSVYLPLSAVEAERLDYEPELPASIKKNNLIRLNKILNGGMKAEVTTQKGNESLVFEEGDPLKIFIKVNRPAYVRLLNVWSDNQQLMLMDNFYIGEGQVDQLIELPFDWVTACPCGTEYIQLFARNEPFEFIEIESENGLDFITEPLETTLSKSRAEDRKEKPIYMAESSIVLTTMDK